MDLPVEKPGLRQRPVTIPQQKSQISGVKKRWASTMLTVFIFITIMRLSAEQSLNIQALRLQNFTQAA